VGKYRVQERLEPLQEGFG